MKCTKEWQKWEPNGSQQQLDPWRCFEDQDPEKELQKHDKAQGHWRGEVKVNFKSVLSTIGKLFRREK